MSGFAGVFGLDDRPVDREVLDRMVRTLTARGPDAQAVHSAGSMGLAHTLLRTTAESVDERQPWTVDGHEWIVSDSRIDDRPNLVCALERQGIAGLGQRPDVELILHAYRVWGDACVDRLLGDFSFGIWDARRKRFFGARDHFGVKPFFYAIFPSHLLVSNTLDCLLNHPLVSRTIDELVIADFLVAGTNLEQETTVYRDVMRLRPGHAFVWDGSGPRRRRYWNGVATERLRYRRQRDYVEHFREVLDLAVADRLRSGSAGIFMSGGLDSTSVALAARRHVDAGGTSCELQAFTAVFDHLFKDDERHYAGIAANALKIPVRFLPGDRIGPYSYWDDPALRTPEPHRHIFGGVQQVEYAEASRFTRVMLTGYGGDPLFQYQTNLVRAWQARDPMAVVDDLVNALMRRQLPPLGIRTTLRLWKQRNQPLTRTYPIPPWLDASFIRRLNLHDRYRARPVDPPPTDPPLTRDAHRALFSPTWARAFELLDSAATGFPIEHRHPFFDLRVVKYVWSIPPVPWSQNKGLLRDAMKDRIPEDVRYRPKTPLAGDQLAAWCRDPATRERLRGLVVSPRATCCAAAFPPHLDGPDIWIAMRPLSLEYWLRMSNLQIP